MTHEEHAHAIHTALLDLERATRRLHRRLARYAAEHGAAAGIGHDLMQLAVVPKDLPPNDGPG